MENHRNLTKQLNCANKQRSISLKSWAQFLAKGKKYLNIQTTIKENIKLLKSQMNRVDNNYNITFNNPQLPIKSVQNKPNQINKISMNLKQYSDLIKQTQQRSQNHQYPDSLFSVQPKLTNLFRNHLAITHPHVWVIYSNKLVFLYHKFYCIISSMQQLWLQRTLLPQSQILLVNFQQNVDENLLLCLNKLERESPERKQKNQVKKSRFSEVKSLYHLNLLDLGSQSAIQKSSYNETDITEKNYYFSVINKQNLYKLIDLVYKRQQNSKQYILVFAIRTDTNNQYKFPCILLIIYQQNNHNQVVEAQQLPLDISQVNCILKKAGQNIYLINNYQILKIVISEKSQKLIDIQKIETNKIIQQFEDQMQITNQKRQQKYIHKGQHEDKLYTDDKIQQKQIKLVQKKGKKLKRIISLKIQESCSSINSLSTVNKFQSRPYSNTLNKISQIVSSQSIILKTFMHSEIDSIYIITVDYNLYQVSDNRVSLIHQLPKLINKIKRSQTKYLQKKGYLKTENILQIMFTINETGHINLVIRTQVLDESFENQIESSIYLFQIRRKQIKYQRKIKNINEILRIIEANINFKVNSYTLQLLWFDNKNLDIYIQARKLPSLKQPQQNYWKLIKIYKISFYDNYPLTNQLVSHISKKIPIFLFKYLKTSQNYNTNSEVKKAIYVCSKDLQLRGVFNQNLPYNYNIQYISNAQIFQIIDNFIQKPIAIAVFEIRKIKTFLISFGSNIKEFRITQIQGFRYTIIETKTIKLQGFIQLQYSQNMQFLIGSTRQKLYILDTWSYDIKKSFQLDPIFRVHLQMHISHNYVILSNTKYKPRVNKRSSSSVALQTKPYFKIYHLLSLKDQSIQIQLQGSLKNVLIGSDKIYWTFNQSLFITHFQNCLHFYNITQKLNEQNCLSIQTKFLENCQKITALASSDNCLFVGTSQGRILLLYLSFCHKQYDQTVSATLQSLTIQIQKSINDFPIILLGQYNLTNSPINQIYLTNKKHRKFLVRTQFEQFIEFGIFFTKLNSNKKQSLVIQQLCSQQSTHYIAQTALSLNKLDRQVEFYQMRLIEKYEHEKNMIQEYRIQSQNQCDQIKRLILEQSKSVIQIRNRQKIKLEHRKRELYQEESIQINHLKQRKKFIQNQTNNLVRNSCILSAQILMNQQQASEQNNRCIQIQLQIKQQMCKQQQLRKQIMTLKQKYEQQHIQFVKSKQKQLQIMTKKCMQLEHQNRIHKVIDQYCFQEQSAIIEQLGSLQMHKYQQQLQNQLKIKQKLMMNSLILQKNVQKLYNKNQQLQNNRLVLQKQIYWINSSKQYKDQIVTKLQAQIQSQSLKLQQLMSQEYSKQVIKTNINRNKQKNYQEFNCGSLQQNIIKLNKQYAKQQQQIKSMKNRLSDEYLKLQKLHKQSQNYQKSHEQLKVKKKHICMKLGRQKRQIKNQMYHYYEQILKQIKQKRLSKNKSVQSTNNKQGLKNIQQTQQYINIQSSQNSSKIKAQRAVHHNQLLTKQFNQLFYESKTLKDQQIKLRQQFNYYNTIKKQAYMNKNININKNIRLRSISCVQNRHNKKESIIITKNCKMSNTKQIRTKSLQINSIKNITHFNSIQKQNIPNNQPMNIQKNKKLKITNYSHKKTHKLKL